MELLAFAIGFKGAGLIAAIFLVGGGYLGYRYGSGVQARAQSALSKAQGAVGDLEKKL